MSTSVETRSYRADTHLSGTFRTATVSDPGVVELLEDLVVEYDTRYPPPPGQQRSAREEINRYPSAAFQAPDGAFVVYEEDGKVLSGGAFKRLSPDTAEIKRVWTSSQARGRGLATATMAELENLARSYGYQALFLTTGPNQAEEVRLYLACGYAPGFDPAAYPVQPGPHPFSKVIGIPSPISTSITTGRERT
ncbi:MAG: GNAT family N-acetyltransferase [Galactobacter sp.]